MSPGSLYHLALPGEWANAVAAGAYTVSTRGRTLEDEGFVHCSFADQVDGVACLFYADVPDVLLLTIDQDRLGVEVRVEAVDGTDGRFPHVYGPIPIEAVIDVSPYRGPSVGR